jgi:hypothetical protein
VVDSSEAAGAWVPARRLITGNPPKSLLTYSSLNHQVALEASMPSATVDLGDTAIKLFYTDTGPVESADYTTLVFYHGYAFTGRKQTRSLAG